MNLIALKDEHYFTKGTAVFIPYFRYWQITNGLKVQLEQYILKCVHCCCIWLNYIFTTVLTFNNAYLDVSKLILFGNSHKD